MGRSTEATTRIRKTKLLAALEKTMGVVTIACANAEIPRQTYYDWIDEDEKFAKDVQELKGVALDFAESKLFSMIDKESVPATIFYLKCKGRERGYIERQDIDHTTQGDKIKPNVINLGRGIKPEDNE